MGMHWGLYLEYCRRVEIYEGRLIKWLHSGLLVSLINPLASQAYTWSGNSDHVNPFILEIFLTDVVWTYDTFEYNFEINHRFTKYLKEIYRLGSDEHYSFKYFTKKCSSHKDRSHIVRALLAATGTKGLSLQIKPLFKHGSAMDLSLNLCQKWLNVQGRIQDLRKGGGFYLVLKSDTGGVVAPLALIYEDTTRSQLQRTKKNNFIRDITKK